MQEVGARGDDQVLGGQVAEKGHGQVRGKGRSVPINIGILSGKLHLRLKLLINSKAGFRVFTQIHVRRIACCIPSFNMVRLRYSAITLALVFKRIQSTKELLRSLFEQTGFSFRKVCGDRVIFK